MRRFLFWLMVLAVIVAIAGLIFFFFTKKTPTGERIFTLPTNPFGSAPNKPQTGNPTDGNNGQPVVTDPNNPETSSTSPSFSFQPLHKVWDKPVVGFSFAYIPILISSTSTDKKGKEIIVQTRATSSLLFFVEKETGNVYKKDLDKGDIIRVTNTTIPGVQDAYFLANGKYVVMRTYNKKQKAIQTFIANLPQTLLGDNPLPLGKTAFLQENITSLIPSLDTGTLYYLVGGTSDSTVYAWSESKGISFIVNSPLKELLLGVSRGLLVATTKASAFVQGYILSIPLLTSLYGGRTGLTTTLSPSGEYVLSSMWSSKGLLTYIHSLSNGKDRTLQIQALSEKCAWDNTSSFALCAAPDFVPSSSYGLPDDWYQGETHFRDSLYLIGVRSPSESRLFNLSEEAKQDVDLINPAQNAYSSYLGFINKNDNMLWLLNIGYLLNNIPVTGQ